MGSLAAVGAVALLMTVVVVTTRGNADDRGSADTVDDPADASAAATRGAHILDGAQDPAPNPTGNDPSAIGTPPEVDRPTSAADLLARTEELHAAAAAMPPPATRTPPGQPEPVAGPVADQDSLLVTFPAATSPARIDAALAAAGVTGTPIAGTDVVEVSTAGLDQEAVRAALDASSAVEAVEPNLVRHASRNPNDAELGAQAPYLTTIGAQAAWEVADTGSHAVVAVLDTGVDLDHPDLAPNLVAGTDIVNGDSQPADDNGHGTEVAGVIGAVTNNAAGVAGVAWNAQIMPVKVLDAQGVGTDADIAAGIVWAVNHGADVVNMSLGGPGISAILDDAALYALDNEVVLVAAAGNESTNFINYPAGALGVIGVTATDAAGRFAWFSNHGPWYLLSAPGIDIRTTAAGDGAAAYASSTGTSFSSPIVAGVAALLHERHPGWGWFEILDTLTRTSRDAGPAGVDGAYEYGIVDAAAALGVGAHGPVTQPNLSGDAGSLPGAARSIAVGAPSSESLGHEYDEDWFAFQAPSASRATVTVTPPPALETFRAAEMDPVVELFGPGGGRVAVVDATFQGEVETLAVDVGPGRHTVRVRNYGASIGPAPYTVQVDLAAPQGAVAPEGAGPWISAANPAPHATGVGRTVHPTVTFGRDVAPASVNPGTVVLFNGRSGFSVDATVSLSGRTLTLTPRTALTPGVPYLLVIAGVTNPTGSEAALEMYPFTVAGVAPTNLVVNATYSPFRVDLDGNGYDDVFWYAPGSAGDFVWFFDADGSHSVGTSVTGSFTPVVGDFNGNGYDDIYWYAPGAGTDVMWWSGREGLTTQVISVSGTYVPVAGDFNRNGYDDILWYAPGTAADSVWYFGPSGRSTAAEAINGSSYRLAAGDVTRDGFDDVLFYAPGTTAESLWRGRSGSGFQKGGAGLNANGTYGVRSLDFNADGFGEVFFYATNVGTFWRGGATGFVASQAGPPMPSGVRPITGDFTGDVRGDLFAYVPGGGGDRLYVGTASGVS